MTKLNGETRFYRKVKLNIEIKRSERNGNG